MFGAAVILAAVCARGGRVDLGALVLGACAAAWALCPLAAALALRLGASVQPGGRAVHARRTPLLGGLALYVPVVGALLWASGPHVVGLVAGATVLLLAGAWDDLFGLTPRRKLAAQGVAALALVADGVRIPGLSLEPLGVLPLDGFEAAAVVFWILVATNAINLIDGVDGLATTIVLVGAVALAVLGHPSVLALALAGACLGFLRHNLPRARIFLGDAGSLLLGFFLGALALNGGGPMNLPVAAGLLALPLCDMALAILRRWLRGKPLFSADQGHLHHHALRLWRSPPRVLLGLSTLVVAQALAVVLRPDLLGLLLAGGLSCGLLLYVVSRARFDWPRILLQRRAFRRVHVACRYARDVLPLCESRDEVHEVLQRVVQDLDLCGAEVSGVRVARDGLGERVATERVQCGHRHATWSALPGGDPALLEEKRVVMCDLLRRAAARLEGLTPAPAPVPEAVPGIGGAGGVR